MLYGTEQKRSCSPLLLKEFKGGTGAGTRAAVGFITDPQAISALVISLPKGWEKKNIEVLLHASLTNGVPIAPDVVATYCW